ncbi:MAG: prepilin-type N-terminal cleavage/methylation domain-containing protein [Solirubrobacterales bacterium]
MINRVAKRLRDARGHTLIELLVASLLMSVVMGTLIAALFSFTNFVRGDEAVANTRDSIRAMMESMSREIRSANALAPSPNAEQRVISRGEANDIIFKYRYPASPTATGNPANIWNLQRVRYCVDRTEPTNQILYKQVQWWTGIDPGGTANNWAESMLPDTACPAPHQDQTGPVFGGNHDATKYQQTVRLADHIVNTAAQPVFVYNNDVNRTRNYADPNVLASINNVRIQFYVSDENGATGPSGGTAPVSARRVGADLSTSFFLRNVNRTPNAAFSYSNSPGGGVVLNASTSTDPDLDTLKYDWYVDGVKVSTTTDKRIYNYNTTVSNTVSGDPHTFRLVVTDPGLLSDSMEVSIDVL